jgi:DNA polymerase III subunit gamma/tau
VALALYRRYRPSAFAEVLGQEHVTEPLSVALSAGRVHHAYLFSGPRGCGKTSSARILARSLNCEQGPTAVPCGRCPSCIALAPEGPGSIDVVELDAASHGGVDDARDLRDRAFYAPADARFRVFIIDEAHMVTTQGFNALLKIVEEPPEHLVFVFATTEPDKVLPTIRSRTHHYPFRLLPPGVLRGLLERICEQEGVRVEPNVFPLVVRAGGGSARDALSVLDQLLAGAGAEGVTYQRAVALLGVSDVTLIDDMVDGLAAGDGAAVFGAVNRLVEAGHDPRRFAADLLERFRDLTLLQAVPDAAARGLMDAPADELARMSSQADGMRPAELARYGEIVHNGLIDMRGATAPRLLLELLCGRMLLPAASSDNAALVQRLELIERRLTIAAPLADRDTSDARSAVAERVPVQRPDRDAGGRSATVPTPAAPAASAAPAAPPSQTAAEPASPAWPAAEPPEAESPVQAGDEQQDTTAVRRQWPEVVDRVSKRSRVTFALMNGSSVQAIHGDTLVVAASTAPMAKRLSEQRHVDQITEALRETFGVAWRVRFAEPGSGPAAPATTLASAPAPVTAPPSRRQPVQRREPPANRGQERAARPRPPGRDEVPPPDEPPPDDEEALLAEAAADDGAGNGQRRDPAEVALELLADQLGARKID